MDIQQYIAADKELLLNLNGSQSLFWDGFMWVATSTIVWVPVAAMLLYIIIKNNKIQEALLTIVMIALVITLADQIASGLCKPFFARFRPTQDPNIMYMVDIVNGYRGGRFGFISSHAANTFAISVFLSLLIKRKSLTFMLLFLHAYFSPIYVPTIPYGTDNFNFQIEREESVKSMIETVHNELNKLSDTIKKKVESGEFPNIKYTCILRDGIPEEEILRYAKEYNPQIIIMGTRGRSQKDIDLIGSVTAEVIERSKSFVYAIPEHTPLKTFNDIKKVAFVTNFDQRDLIAFDSLINAFKSFHFAVSFIHLSTDNDAWNEIKLAGIKDYFQKQYSKLELYYNVVKEDNILNNLDNYVKEENIDVICITNYKRNIFARLFNPSIARKMIFHANTPILVIK